MTDAELKRMKREELLQLLIEQMKENEALQKELEAAKAQLEDRKIIMEESGSIAEAALRLNGVFDSAQAAAQQYLENLQRMSEAQDSTFRQMEEEAQKKADAILAEASVYSRKLREDADTYWNQVVNKVEKLLKEKEDLRGLLQSAEKK